MMSAAVLALSFTTAHAAVGPVAQVSVAIGPALQAKAHDYGERELSFLANDLRQSVETRLARVGAMSPAGGRLELVIADAKPNRPTMAQMSHKPGLSMQSFGIGGATVDGAYVSPDGARTPVHYRWYEHDIRWAPYQSTWGDAQDVFDHVGDQLVRGDAYALR